MWYDTSQADDRLVLVGTWMAQAGTWMAQVGFQEGCLHHRKA